MHNKDRQGYNCVSVFISEVYLELKQNMNTTTCISNMMKDWDKVMSGRSKSEFGDEIRGLF